MMLRIVPLVGIVVLTVGPGCGRVGYRSFEPAAEGGSRDASASDAGSSGGPDVEWARAIGAQVRWTNGPKVDGAGNIYLSGAFEGELELLGEVHRSEGQLSLFLASFTAAGDPRWLRSYRATVRVTPHGLDVHTDGTSVLCGAFQGELTLADQPRDSAAGQDAFVMFHDAAGTYQSTHAYGAEYNFQCHDVDVSADRIASGGFYQTSGSADFGGHLLPPTLWDDPYITEMGWGGSTRWAARMHASRWARTASLSWRTDGSLCTAGSFEADIDLDDDGVVDAVSAGDEDAYVGARGPGGGLVWARAFGAAGGDRGEDVLGVGTSCLLVGTVSDRSATGAVEIGGGGQDDAFAILFDEAGEALWARTLGGPGRERGFRVARSAEGFYVTGTFDGEMTVAGTTLRTRGGRDVFVARMDPNGRVEAASSFGGPGDESVSGIVADPNDGSLLLGGASGGGIETDEGPLSPPGTHPAFLVRLEAP